MNIEGVSNKSGHLEILIPDNLWSQNASNRQWTSEISPIWTISSSQYTARMSSTKTLLGVQLKTFEVPSFMVEGEKFIKWDEVCQ